MVINEEIIAAYIEGNVTVEERKKVREFLAQNHIEQDLVFSLMEGTNALDEDCQEQKPKVISENQEHSFREIAYSAAAFAPKTELEAPQGKGQNRIAQRIGRMSTFLKEIDQEG